MPSHFRLLFVFPHKYPDAQYSKCNKVIEHQLWLEKDLTQDLSKNT